MAVRDCIMPSNTNSDAVTADDRDDLYTALERFLAEADAGHVTVETDRAARAALAKARPSTGEE